MGKGGYFPALRQEENERSRTDEGLEYEKNGEVSRMAGVEAWLVGQRWGELRVGAAVLVGRHVWAGLVGNSSREGLRWG